MDKMIIEQKAKDYASFEKGGKCYPNYAVECACRKAFIDGINHVLSIPLAERLKEEEKKKVKAFYNGDTFGELDFIEVVSCRRILKSIFGEDFFKENT